MAGSITELSKYRYERALEDLKDAEEQISKAEQFLGYVECFLKDKNII